MKNFWIAVLAGGCYSTITALGCLVLAVLMAPPRHELLITASMEEMKAMALWGMMAFAFSHLILRGIVWEGGRPHISLGVLLVVVTPTLGWVFIPQAPLETISVLLCVSFIFSYDSFRGG